MLLSNSRTDPIVEILILAYRRGLSLRQEQVKEKVEAINLERDERPTDQISSQPEKVQTQDGN